jgi:hypothetical protein
MINSAQCLGYRSRDDIIYRLPAGADCWRAADVQWSAAQASAYAKFIGVPMSRPTLIKFVRDNNAGWQLGTGRWVIYPDKFRLLLRIKNAQN